MAECRIKQSDIGEVNGKGKGKGKGNGKRKGKGKLKFALQHFMKAQRQSRIVTLLVL